MKVVQTWKIRAVARYIKVMRSWKDADGESHFDEKQVGWKTVFDPFGISIVTEEEPDWMQGQFVRVTIEVSPNARDMVVNLPGTG